MNRQVKMPPPLKNGLHVPLPSNLGRSFNKCLALFPLVTSKQVSGVYSLHCKFLSSVDHEYYLNSELERSLSKKRLSCFFSNLKYVYKLRLQIFYFPSRKPVHLGCQILFYASTDIVMQIDL